ncbi:MAG TPA: ADOP family duplicated permease [Gemmatimonadaceae bacterium]|nr:ADOP family duplicated permease [Gemmatimonadaceae bacterium]
MNAFRDLRLELRRAARSLRRTPVVTAAAVVSIGLGAAAATTVFSVVDAALFRPPPFERASDLAVLFMTRARSGEWARNERWSWPRFRALAAAQRSFERVASFSGATVAFTSGNAEPVEGEFVSSDYFALLGVRPIAGRSFDASADDAATAEPVVLLGADLSKSRFGGDDVIGRKISLNGVELTIIGILPSGFKGLSGRASLWMPAPMAVRATYADYLVSNQSFISVVGRLRAGGSMPSAIAELAVLGPQIGRFRPLRDQRPDDVVAATALTMNDARIDPSTRRPLLLLLGGAACLLLLACANVAGLLLGRAATRRRDVALQAALGASRWRIIRQLLAESSLIALGGAAIGIALAWPLTAHAGVPAAAFRGRNFYGAVGEFAAPRVDDRVLAFSLGLCALTVLLFGLLPAIQSTRVDLTTALNDSGGGRGVVGPRSMRLRHVLVGAETALALVLLAAGGLFAASLRALANTNVGFDRHNLIAFTIRPSDVKYPAPKAPPLITHILDEVRRLPGVDAASVDGCAPLSTGCASTSLFIDGRPWASRDAAPFVLRHYVGPEHFRVLGAPLLRGRTFTDADRAGSERVAVINETAARRFWPDEDPIGRRVWFGGGSNFDRPDSAATIVGIVGDVAYQPLDDHPVQADFYTPYAQFTYASRTVLVRTRGDPRGLIADLRRAVQRANPELAIFDARTLEEHAGDSWTRVTYQATILAAFAVVALLLSAIGVFAIITQVIGDRVHEIGLRIVLGAGPRKVLAAVGSHGLMPALLGVVVGLAAAIGVGRVFAAFLFGVPALDVVVLGAVTALVLLVAITTTYLGARRALSISPMDALRSA